MSVTWSDLKAQLVDLGFEEDEITSETEYGRLIRNSVNRALDIVYQTVALRIEGYYKVTQSWGYEDENGKWKIPKPKHVDEQTEDDYRISLADNLTFLVAHHQSHDVLERVRPTEAGDNRHRQDTEKRTDSRRRKFLNGTDKST